MRLHVVTLFLSRIFRTFQFARRYSYSGFFGRFGLHDVIFVADGSVCTTVPQRIYKIAYPRL